ncbi:MAG: glycosyltransferase, partial [Candidatus Omnitrophota bacterium]|nr:glycosyltransferase [Candidatus Omnitrophota bacterium]
MLGNKKIVVVMPAYNAARTLTRTYGEIPKDIVDDIILTDDRSSDDTVEIAKTLN